MTHAFPCSRLAEIAEAAPVRPVSFPAAAQVDVIRATLQRVREMLASQAAGGAGKHKLKLRRPAISKHPAKDDQR
jgi:hypothetical protein